MKGRDLRAVLRTLREERFEAKLESIPRGHHEVRGEKRLSVTYNGFQWQALALTPAEAAKVIAVLKPHAAKARKR